MGEPVELLEDADIDIREGEGINSQVLDRLLGRGVVSLKILMLALRKVNSGGERLGDLAVNQGFLSRDDVDSILEKTERRYSSLWSDGGRNGSAYD